jgi:hypothetical protein
MCPEAVEAMTEEARSALVAELGPTPRLGAFLGSSFVAPVLKREQFWVDLAESGEEARREMVECILANIGTGDGLVALLNEIVFPSTGVGSLSGDAGSPVVSGWPWGSWPRPSAAAKTRGDSWRTSLSSPPLGSGGCWGTSMCSGGGWESR